jgi:hypothetical protein
LKIKRLSIISPLHFNKESYFYYEIRFLSFFLKFLERWAQYKPDFNEINLLESIIIENKNNNIFNNNNKFIDVTEHFFLMISCLEKIPHIFDEIDKNMKGIIINYNRSENISLKKLQECYYRQFGKKLSITSIN